jgi:hypothetical protein
MATRRLWRRRLGTCFCAGFTRFLRPARPEAERKVSRRVEEEDYVYTTPIAAI